MRILMLAPHPHVRGPIAKHTVLLVDALRRAGCVVATEPWGRHHDEERMHEKLLSRSGDVLRVRRRLEAERFDVLVIKTGHDWSTVTRDLMVVLAGRKRVPKIVLQLQGSFPDRVLGDGQRAFKSAMRQLLAKVDAVMVLSTEEQAKWSRFAPAVPFYTVKNPFAGVAADRGERPPASNEVPQLLFVGRLLREKGLFELVEALAEANARSPSALSIVGDGPVREQLAAEVRRLHLDERVTFRGYLHGDELAAAYRAADIFVLPSWSEGFPTVIAEAMGHGLPVITTRIRGAADHLVEGENALFCEVRDVAGLERAIGTLAADPELRRRMAAANLERVRIFEPDIVACEYLAVLEEVVGDGPAAERVGAAA
jgi:glycosyltransferase involved in cell wall biosynthesis